MFRDSLPINMLQDQWSLVLRKLLRIPASSAVSLAAMGQVVRFLESYCPSPGLLQPLYRWVTGANIFRGFRDGLSEYWPLPVLDSARSASGDEASHQSPLDNPGRGPRERKFH
jgi:hypothetical protein